MLPHGLAKVAKLELKLTMHATCKHVLLFLTSVKARDKTADLQSPLTPDTSLLQLHAQYVQCAETGPRHNDIHAHIIRMPA